MRTRTTLAAALIGAAILAFPGFALAQRAATPTDPISVMMAQERQRHKAAMVDLRQRQSALRGAARIQRKEAELEALRAGKPAKATKTPAAHQAPVTRADELST